MHIKYPMSALRLCLTAVAVASLASLVPALTVFATSNTWTAMAPMPGGGRQGLAAATGPDGRIYAIGGYDGSSILDRVEAFNTNANTWFTVAPMPGGVRYTPAAATGPDGRIYAIGGYDGSFLNRVEAYDTNTNTWTTVAPMPGGGRELLAAATGPDGRIYAIGGYDGSRLNRVEAYDSTTNTWTTIAAMPGGGRSDLGAATGPDGRIYVIGGSDGTANLSRVEAYDTTSNTWTTLAPMPGGARSLLAAATGPDGRIYAIGGSDGPGGSGQLDRVEAYNVNSNTWTTAQAMAGGARNFLAGATGPDGRIYAVGGRAADNTTSLDRLEAYTTIGGRLSATGTSITATEGRSFSGARLASFSDADENTSPSNYSASINWGDATSSSGTINADGSGGFTVTGSHTYTEEGTFLIAVKISDLDGNTVSANSAAAVADASLTASGLHLKQSNRSVSGVVANFADADPNGALSDYSAVIKWGDGTSSTGTVAPSGGSFTVSGSHHYHKDVKETIKVVITDTGGSTATATTTAKA